MNIQRETLYILFKNYFWILIVIAAIFADRVSKVLVVEHLQFEEPMAIMPFFNLFFTFNAGAAFSFLESAGGWQEWLFGSVAVLVSIWLLIWLFRIHKRHNWLKIALALILGGTLGNLYDRIMYQHVIDFIDLYVNKLHWPAFNIADSAICIGAIMLVVDIAHKGKTAHH